MSKLLFGVLSLALTACVSWNMASAADDNGGQQPKHKRPDPAAVFAKLDTNGDGFLSLDEFSKAPFIAKRNLDEAKQKALFAKIDTNGDGKISPDEFKTFMESHKGQHGKGKQQQQQQQDPSK